MNTEDILSKLREIKSQDTKIKGFSVPPKLWKELQSKDMTIWCGAKDEYRAMPMNRVVEIGYT